jgi:acetyl esterase/lipase
MNRRSMFGVITFASLLTTFTACRITDWQLWSPPQAAPDACEIERLRDVSYHDGPQADLIRHKLDLFVPKGKKSFPVVVLVHGGAWMIGDNRCCGLYSSVGEYLASQGIGAVLPNYRLSPEVKHPEHVKDVARAFAWTKRRIADHGGDPRKIFLVGHSAGGHLVALLATDEQYLKAEGCRTDDVKGVVGVSAVYRIPAGNAEVELGGASPGSLRLDEMAPIRGKAFEGMLKRGGGIPMSVNIFAPAFGGDPQARANASPVNHVRKHLPPFLIVSASNDLPLLPAMASEMHETLQKHGCTSRLITVEQRNHNSIIFKAVEPADPVARAIVEFVRK